MKFLLTLATALTMAFMLTAGAVSFGAGVPAAVHYIDHEKVTAVMSKGGPSYPGESQGIRPGGISRSHEPRVHHG